MKSLRSRVRSGLPVSPVDRGHRGSLRVKRCRHVWAGTPHSSAGTCNPAHRRLEVPGKPASWRRGDPHTPGGNTRILPRKTPCIKAMDEADEFCMRPSGDKKYHEVSTWSLRKSQPCGRVRSGFGHCCPREWSGLHPLLLDICSPGTLRRVPRLLLPLVQVMGTGVPSVL